MKATHPSEEKFLQKFRELPEDLNLGTHGSWTFAEFTEIYRIETDCEAKVEAEFNKMVEQFTSTARV